MAENSNNFKIQTNQHFAKNLSLPKDTQSFVVEKTSTPKSQQPVRRSSSTPRRTSHVRVLDFNTPRQIFLETVPENLTKVTVEVNEIPNTYVHKNQVPIESVPISTDNNTLKEINSNKKSTNITRNWDADLRALALAGNQQTSQKPPPKRSKKKKNTPATSDDTNDKSDSGKKGKCKRKSHTKKAKINNEVIKDSVKTALENVDVPKIKPTINIITDWNDDPTHDKDRNNKSNQQETNTPEMDRVSLHNAIGAKLNISDFLETPIKQVWYDIQMETPRFLGHDILTDSMSDIKIMSIPTPRLLNTSGFALTPKPANPTPSSYSSRPTDYSSGGSYYKPDEHDYAPIANNLEPKTSSPLEKENKPSTIMKVTVTKVENQNKEKAVVNRSRPVRQCTKNISYYNMVHKMKNEDTPNKNLTSEDSLNDSDDYIPETNEKTLTNTNEEEILKNVEVDLTKTDLQKKVSFSSGKSKQKSPIKKGTPKISTKSKSKKVTDVRDKQNISKSKRKTSESNNNAHKKESRKKMNSKDKSQMLDVSPVYSPAPTKSRRKSSTPRKLHCTKSNLERARNNSPESTQKKTTLTQEIITRPSTDAETSASLRANEGSQDAKHENSLEHINEPEDITKIKEYIEQTSLQKNNFELKLHITNYETGPLHKDLMKRGFDLDTAKSIERDLLDNVSNEENVRLKPVDTTVKVHSGKQILLEGKVKTNDTNVKNNNSKPSEREVPEETLKNDSLIEEEEYENDLEFSVHDYDEKSDNFIEMVHDESYKSEQSVVKLKDKFCMEVCIEDVTTVRLQATSLTTLIDEAPKIQKKEGIEKRKFSINLEPNIEETQAAVNSILNIDKFYSPRKYMSSNDTYMQICDSTLTQTPLKSNEPMKHVTEVILEVEQITETPPKERPDAKKRKRLQSGSTTDDSESDSKKKRAEPPYLATIQNFDIESVLSKLHGP